MIVFTAAVVVVLAFALYLVVLGVGAFAFRPAVTTFLLGFASSAWAHYLEMSVRLLVGASFIVVAPRMAWPLVFGGFGWILVGTTLPLLLVPWQWHHRLARRIVPPFLRVLAFVGLCSIAAGVAIAGAVIHGLVT